MNATIAAVHNADVSKVRQILRGAILEASEAWLPSDAIIDALTLEIVEMAGRHGSSARLAAQLTEILALLSHPQERAH